MGRGPVGEGDEDVVEQLARGAALLAAGRPAEAREPLEAAHRLQPRSEEAQSLLGLCYFKLGLLDRAAEVYERLVRENPVDVTLRVNLGLVYLKSGALQRAVREFETATDLTPEHQRVHDYLGLTLAQAGEYGRAREHFLLAGSEHMAQRMARAIAGEAFARQALSSPPAGPSAPSGTSRAVGGAASAEAPRPPSLGGLAESVRLLPTRPGHLFELREGALSVVVRGEVFTRLEGLLSVEGQVDFIPARRRERGRPVEVPFGAGDAQLVRARGDGVLLFHVGSRVCLPVTMGEESAYLREEAVFAFEDSVVYENGRLSVEGGTDLPMVQLRGTGRVLLRLGGPLRSQGVAAGRPVVVPLAHLVGWQGELVPRVVALAGRASAGVELTGQGFALLALAAAR